MTELAGTARKRVRWILDEGFTGMYRLHARYMLRSVPTVILATVEGRDSGTMLLDNLTPAIGYVYYIAVAREYRHGGIGGRMLDYALTRMKREGKEEMYAVRDSENKAAGHLFGSRGFSEVDLKDFSKRFGFWRAMRLRRRMTMVYGELLMSKSLQGVKQ